PVAPSCASGPGPPLGSDRRKGGAHGYRGATIAIGRGRLIAPAAASTRRARSRLRAHPPAVAAPRRARPRDPDAVERAALRARRALPARGCQPPGLAARDGPRAPLPRAPAAQRLSGQHAAAIAPPHAAPRESA